MQAIICKYLRPTDTKGPRIKAVCAAGSFTVGYHDSDRSDPHLDAAEGLCKKLGWVSAPGNLYTSLARGDLPNGDVVFTFIPDEYEKAKQAVFETRYAIRHGQNNGNPHLRAYGRAVDALTDDLGVWSSEFNTFAQRRDMEKAQ